MYTGNIEIRQNFFKKKGICSLSRVTEFVFADSSQRGQCCVKARLVFALNCYILPLFPLDLCPSFKPDFKQFMFDVLESFQCLTSLDFYIWTRRNTVTIFCVQFYRQALSVFRRDYLQKRISSQWKKEASLRFTSLIASSTRFSRIPPSCWTASWSMQ